MAKNGFLIIELLIALGLCSLLCSIIVTYQWYSMCWHHDSVKRWQALHLLEEMIDLARVSYRQCCAMLPVEKEGIVITGSEESRNIHFETSPVQLTMRTIKMSATWLSATNNSRSITATAVVIE